MSSEIKELRGSSHRQEVGCLIKAPSITLIVLRGGSLAAKRKFLARKSCLKLRLRRVIGAEGSIFQKQKAEIRQL
jgi:hypothetical protein